MANEFTLTLDIYQQTIQTISIEQYSKNVNKVNVYITARGTAYDIDRDSYNVYLKVKTPDDRYVYYHCSVSATVSNLVVFTLPESVSWTAGRATAQLEGISDDGKTRFVTSTFEIVINPAAYPESVITGSNEFSALVSALGRIPNPPTTDGTYTLTVTISGNTRTYSWE